MCDPKPGARCSYDTSKELAEAKMKFERAEREFERSQEAASAARLERAIDNLERKQAAFDSAPRGQRDLAALIRSSADPASPEVDELRSRLAIGRQTRIDQKRALARSRGKSSLEENVEAEKVLSRLRHPELDAVFSSGLSRSETVGFFVLLPQGAGVDSGGAVKLATAEASRALAAEVGATEFYDAQLGTAVKTVMDE